MPADADTFESPYPRTPGASLPGPATTPEEGRADLWVFFWVSVAGTVIIAAAGIGAWLYVHR